MGVIKIILLFIIVSWILNCKQVHQYKFIIKNCNINVIIVHFLPLFLAVSHIFSL